MRWLLPVFLVVSLGCAELRAISRLESEFQQLQKEQQQVSAQLDAGEITAEQATRRMESLAGSINRVRASTLTERKNLEDKINSVASKVETGAKSTEKVAEAIKPFAQGIHPILGFAVQALALLGGGVAGIARKFTGRGATDAATA